MATGNTNYDGNDAFSTELVIKRDFENAWLRKAVALAMIREGKKNWNKGGSVKGTKFLLPVELGGPLTAAAGRADTDEFTAVTPHATTNFFQAEYTIAHYIGTMSDKRSEMVLLKNDRGDWRQGKINQLMGSFTDVLANDEAGTTIDQRTNLLGVQYAIATGNSPGGISQSTDTDWKGQVTTSAGAFSLDLLDAKIDAVDVRNGKIDLIRLAFSSTYNLFGALRQQIAPAQRIQNEQFRAKYGFLNIDYLGAMCVSDNRLASGSIVGQDTSSWYYRGHTHPVRAHEGPIQNTDAVEQVWYMFAVIGCDNPAKNFNLTGATA